MNRTTNLVTALAFAFVFPFATAQFMSGSIWAAVENTPPREGISPEDSPLEEIVVTGSYIKRQSQKQLASPTTVLSRSAFAEVGAKDIRDVIQTLTINTGAQNNADVFTQNITAGTSNINLRGLGLASTLVLLNGRRQVQTGVQTTDGISFVDTNALVPTIAIERLDILKDGASAIFGSEAVAGVANFITRDSFEGLELQVDGQWRATNGDQNDYQIAAIAGVSGTAGHSLIALSYLDRSILTADEVDFLTSVHNRSGLGSPGSIITSQGRVADPGCEANGGFVTNNNSLCQFDFGPNQTFVPQEQRVNAFAKHSVTFKDSLSGWLEASYAQNRAERDTSPSFPTILSIPTVPAGHPDNRFGEDVRFFGRPLGNGEPSARNFFNSDTVRVSAGLEGYTGPLDWQVAFTRAVNDYTVIQSDTVVDRYLLALRGFGGFGCDPATGSAGVGPCQYFNPFSSALDGTGTPRSRGIIDFIIGQQELKARSGITVVDAVASTGLFDMAGGEAAIAAGIQYRKESLRQDFDSLSNADAFSFLVGNPDFSNDRDARAFFAELSLPLLDAIELQLAGRYEDIANLGTFDPKIAIRYALHEHLSLRSSWSTSFRAPSLFQQGGTQTSFAQVTDPATSNTFFISVRSFGDPALKPETSTAWNLGFTWEAASGSDSSTTSISADYWHFDFKDVLVQENQQAILDADPFDPRVRRLDDENPDTIDAIGQIFTSFANASSVKTSGLDITARLPVKTGAGVFTAVLDGTYVFRYDLLDPQAGAVDGAGRRNFRNFGTSVPRLRAGGTLGWVSNTGTTSASLSARYISSYQDDEAVQPVDSILTLDAQLNWTLTNGLTGGPDITLTVGALNIGDEAPPFVATNGNYDSKVHDPRGRRPYARIMLRI